jgi:hypothetical protein
MIRFDPSRTGYHGKESKLKLKAFVISSRRISNHLPQLCAHHVLCTTLSAYWQNIPLPTPFGTSHQQRDHRLFSLVYLQSDAGLIPTLEQLSQPATDFSRGCPARAVRVL